MEFAATIASGVYTWPHAANTSGGMQLELWQVINLVGAPLLAILFVRPVIDDVRAWVSWLIDREESGDR